MTDGWKLSPRKGYPCAAVAMENEPAALEAGPGWVVYALRKTDEGLSGPMITVVPGGGTPVLRGNAEQVKNWSNTILVALPVTIG